MTTYLDQTLLVAKGPVYRRIRSLLYQQNHRIIRGQSALDAKEWTDFNVFVKDNCAFLDDEADLKILTRLVTMVVSSIRNTIKAKKGVDTADEALCSAFLTPESLLLPEGLLLMPYLKGPFTCATIPYQHLRGLLIVSHTSSTSARLLLSLSCSHSQTHVSSNLLLVLRIKHPSTHRCYGIENSTSRSLAEKAQQY